MLRSAMLVLAAVLLTAPAFAQTCTSDPECDDSNTATVDTCDPVDGCQHDAPTAAKRLAMRAAPTNPVKAAFKFISLRTITVSNPPFSGGDSDPVIHGASLRVKADSGEFDVTYPLPAANWTYVGDDPVANRGFWYKDKNQLSGPIRFVVIRDAFLARSYGTGPGLGITLGQNPQAVDVVLTLGDATANGNGTKFCMRFGGTTSYVQDLRFRGTAAPAPVACP